MSSPPNGPADVQLQLQLGLESALRNYEMATRILPGHVYAWHDIFSVNSALVEQGNADLVQMRVALDEARNSAEANWGSATRTSPSWKRFW
jgi:hypothetical protein